VTLAIVACSYLCLSLVTLAVYAWDKRAAQKKKPRTPELTLHVLSLLGGWPGALIAQRTLRHKTRKLPFQLVFWLTAIANCALLISLYKLT